MKAIRELDNLQVKLLQTEDIRQEYVEFSVAGRVFRYCVPNRLSGRRARTLFTKEPTTTVWLQTFRPYDVFVDIGANIGLYSVYAGVYTGCTVYAFEPEAQNFAQLNLNFFLNELHDRSKAFCLAITTKTSSAVFMSTRLDLPAHITYLPRPRTSVAATGSCRVLILRRWMS